MGNSLLCHYIDNCFKKGIILWGQKHCDWGGKVEEWGGICPPVPMLKKALYCNVAILGFSPLGPVPLSPNSIAVQFRAPLSCENGLLFGHVMFSILRYSSRCILAIHLAPRLTGKHTSVP